jgi:hypothetical protein
MQARRHFRRFFLNSRHAPAPAHAKDADPPSGRLAAHAKEVKFVIATVYTQPWRGPIPGNGACVLLGKSDCKAGSNAQNENCPGAILM